MRRWLIAAVMVLVVGLALVLVTTSSHAKSRSTASTRSSIAPSAATKPTASPSPSSGVDPLSISSTATPIPLPAEPSKRAESSPAPPPPRLTPGPPVGAGAGVTAAAAYATSRGYQAGVAVLDTQTGQVWGGGNATGYFATESVVKVFIAARILVMGQMTGATEATAYKMITQSDDDSADALYGLVGGDGVVAWAAAYFHIAYLGSGPTLAGWWSNAHISAVGMVQFYAAVKTNTTVWPWLSDAMAHATEDGSDGTYQYFGIPSATTGFAVKQGWGQDDDDWDASSDFNSTGFVNNNRYAVAILVKGPPSGYDKAVPDMVTAIAQILMPGGICKPG